MEKNEDILVHTTDIVASYVSNNAVAGTDLPELIASVYQALATIGAEPTAEETHEPVVSVKASIKPDHLVCLECGAKQKTLKRHLNAAHGLSPEEYRTRYNLPSSYPLVSAEYAKRRSKLAKQIGLGRK
jgi:predicted transcriptional regulator